MWEIASYSHIGTRMANEDRILVTDLGNAVCVTLADGVGGHGGGSTAANAVTRKMNRIFEEMMSCPPGRDKLPGKEEISHAMREVNRTVLGLQTRECRLQAACVTLWILETEDCCSVRWAHVGDSRLYFFREGKCCFITKDHSLRELLKDAGDPKQSAIDRNVIWQAMGEPEGICPEISEKIYIGKEPAVFLICSDGLWEGVSTEIMEETLKGTDSPDKWLKSLRRELGNTGQKNYDNNSAAAIFLNI